MTHPAAPHHADAVSSESDDLPFFVPDGDWLAPAPFADSPWGDVMHGRLIGGLAARAVGAAYAQDHELHCSRLTIDMFRSARLSPVRVVARPLRAGRRIAVLQVEVEQEDGPIGHGLAVMLRRGEQPDGDFRHTPKWDAPTPQQIGRPRSPSGRWRAPFQSWSAQTSGDSGPRDQGGIGRGLSGGMWLRDTHPLVAGEPLTPLIRLAIAADLASPVANASSRSLQFINADYTLSIGREPVGEYIGIQPLGRVSAHGVAVGQCVVHDLDGPCGFVATTALANASRR